MKKCKKLKKICKAQAMENGYPSYCLVFLL